MHIPRTHYIEQKSENFNVIFDSAAAVRAFLQTGKKIDFLFTTTGRHATGAIYGFKKSGLRVPEDVKVFGFDNTIFSLISDPQISSIDRRTQTMVTTACEKLLQAIDSGEKGGKCEEICIPYKVVLRGSTGHSVQM